MTNTATQQVTATRTPKRKQFLDDLLITAIEGGIDYWAGFVGSAERDEKLNITKARLYSKDQRIEAEARIEAAMSDEQWNAMALTEKYRTMLRYGLEVHEVTIETMAKGLGIHSKSAQFVEQCWGTRPGNGLTVANRSNGEEGDYDASDADGILQLGVFGKVIYG